MAMLNDSNDLQPLFDRTLEGLKENHQEHILEFVTMMVKAKRHEEVLEYLTHHDHVEYVDEHLCTIDSISFL